jgi:hypothetical protein
MTMIEVATIQPAPPGKKMGKLMTTGGEPYHVWPNDISKFQQGGRYEIEFEENEFQGRTYRKIKKAKPVVNGSNNHAARSQPMAKPNDEEWLFVRELLSVGLRTGAVAFSAHDLRTAIAMLRTVWRELR